MEETLKENMLNVYKQAIGVWYVLLGEEYGTVRALYHHMPNYEENKSNFKLL